MHHRPSIIIFLLVFICFIIRADSENVYEALRHFGEPADEESIELLEETARAVGVNHKPLLLFKVQSQFEPCGQVRFYTHEGTEYLIVRVWKSLFDELTQGEKKALLGHEMMHVKNGDLGRTSTNWWLMHRLYRCYAMAISTLTAFDKSGFVCMRAVGSLATLLVCEQVFEELHILHDFQQSRAREMQAELGAARKLCCAHDALSLNKKIAEKISGDQEKPEGFFKDILDASTEYVASFYSTHPSQKQFDTELRAMAQQQKSLAMPTG